MTVTKSGNTRKLEWTLKGESAIKGTGVILDRCSLAATGTYEGKPFVFLLKADGAKYVGIWTVGRETWIPQ